MGTIPGLVLLELVVELLLFEVGQDGHAPAQERLALCAQGRGPRKTVVRGVKVVHRQGDLLEVVHTPDAQGRLA